MYLENVRNPRIVLPATPEPLSRVWHLFVVGTNDRGELRRHLEHGGIGTAVHYPVPPHRQRALARFRDLSLPVTEQLHREVRSLPLHTALPDGEVERIVGALNRF
jgi:dTDP-4-amino-4,6-dideoxygalactose transaminase